MWDKPEQLNVIANTLYAIAGLAIAYVLVWHVVHLPVFPLREVRVLGTPVHVTYAQVAEIAKTELKGNFFTLNLRTARAAFEKLPWVRSVTVRRKWPDRLELGIEEHVALARWGNAGLVNVQGEVFRAAYDGELPIFIGPPDTAKEIAIQYNFFRRALEPLGKTPIQVQVTPRRAWQLRLTGGTTIELGRERVEERLSRFVAVYEHSLGRLQRHIDYVDLRYANGFAVRIPGLALDKGTQHSGGPQRKRG
jgi:cell division protein FtsQ